MRDAWNDVKFTKDRYYFFNHFKRRTKEERQTCDFSLAL